MAMSELYLLKNQPQSTTSTVLLNVAQRGGGVVVSVLALYSEDSGLNPAGY